MPPKIDPVLRRNGHKYRDDGHALTSIQDEEPGHELKPVEIDKKRLQFLKHNNPVQFRELAEKTLIEIVRFMVARNGGHAVDFFAVQQEGSYKIGVSLETIKRYVFTHSAGSAELRLTGKKVGINPDFIPEAEEGDEEDAG